MKRLAVIHTAPFVVDILKRLLGERFPELESFHMKETSPVPAARSRKGHNLPIVVKENAAAIVWRTLEYRYCGVF